MSETPLFTGFLVLVIITFLVLFSSSINDSIYSSSASPLTTSSSSRTTTTTKSSAAPAQRSLSPRDLDPVSFAPEEGDSASCCKSLRNSSISLLSIPSDIQLLLPVLGAYQREDDIRTVVELGSRFGSSTATMLRMMSYDMKKRFATVDLEIRQPVKLMYACEKKCTEKSFPDREFFTVQGDDLSVKIPFVDEEEEKKAERAGGKPYRPIDMLFIDTLHAGSQLHMELQRYPKYVRKHLVFHDSYSYRLRNEGPVDFLPPGWPKGKPKPMGLQPVLREFLLTHPEWIEEMNNIHNNGFYVLRRREVSVDSYVTLMDFPRYSGFEVEPEKILISLLAPYVNQIQARFLGSQIETEENLLSLLPQRKLIDVAVSECNGAYGNMCRILGEVQDPSAPPCLLSVGFTRRTRSSPLYNVLISTPDSKLPFASLMPVLMSQVHASLERQGEEEKENLQLPTIIWGCEVSAAVAAIQAQSQTTNETTKATNERSLLMFFVGDSLTSAYSYSSSTKKSICPRYYSNFLENFEARLVSGMYKRNMWTQKKNKKKRNNSVSVFVISAKILSEASDADLALIAKVTKHRIVSYGTSIYSVHRAHEYFTKGMLLEKDGEEENSEENNESPTGGDSFELKIGLGSTVGFSMWEKKSSTALLYILDAKKRVAGGSKKTKKSSAADKTEGGETENDDPASGK